MTRRAASGLPRDWEMMVYGLGIEMRRQHRAKLGVWEFGLADGRWVRVDVQHGTVKVFRHRRLEGDTRRAWRVIRGEMADAILAAASCGARGAQRTMTELVERALGAP